MIRFIRNSRARLLVLAVAWMAVPATLAEDPVAFQVITHSSNSIDAVTPTQLSRIFLKKVKRWDHGLGAMPVDQHKESPVRDSFTRAIHGKTVSSITNYWLRQIYSGRDVPPSELNSDQEVLEVVGRTRGAVGYVSSEARLTGDVKVLEIRDRPLD